MKTFRVKYKKNFEGTVKAESLEEAQKLCENPTYLYYDVNATDMGEEGFEFEEVEQTEELTKYKVYATTVNVYEVEVEVAHEGDARDAALNIWDAKGLIGFTKINEDCDFEVNDYREVGDEDGELEYLIATGFERQRD